MHGVVDVRGGHVRGRCSIGDRGPEMRVVPERDVQRDRERGELHELDDVQGRHLRGYAGQHHHRSGLRAVRRGHALQLVQPGQVRPAR